MQAKTTLSNAYSVHCKVRDFDFYMDEPLDKGGANLGPKPMEMVASSLAGCTAITIKMYASRKGWDLGEISVTVDHFENDLQPGDQRPKNRFEIAIRISNVQSPEVMDRIFAISKKCPVHQLLAPGSDLNSRWAD